MPLTVAAPRRAAGMRRLGSPEHVLAVTEGERAQLAVTAWITDRQRHRSLDVDWVTLDAQRPVGGADGVQDDAVITRSIDLVVVGAERSRTVARRLGCTTAARSAGGCPAVLVPRRWSPSDGPVVVADTGDDLGRSAIVFAVAEALALRRELVIVAPCDLLGLIDPFAVPPGPEADPVTWLALDRRAAWLRSAFPGLLATAVGRGRSVSAVRAAIGSGGVVLGVLGATAVAAVGRAVRPAILRVVLDRPASPIAIVPAD